MLSKNKIKYIQSLSRKKMRDETGLFIAEGEKLITELINSGFQFKMLIGMETQLQKFASIDCEKIFVNEAELKKISMLTTPPPVIAVCFQHINNILSTPFKNDLTIVLDSIQDPGNFGTIIRLASWFGIDQIICSETTVDCYNPKVIQATMGAIAHVNIYYTNLFNFLKNSISNGRSIYGTFMEGENIYTTELEQNGIIVFGNEGKGISTEISEIITRKISIPPFMNNRQNVESLNVSIATAIVCSEFRRRNNSLT
jgi:RNA methyltransferase, TrmH family